MLQRRLAKAAMMREKPDKMRIPARHPNNSRRIQAKTSRRVKTKGNSDIGVSQSGRVLGDGRINAEAEGRADERLYRLKLKS